jgi:hypothetical protein
VGLALVSAMACGDDPSGLGDLAGGGATQPTVCSIPQNLIFNGGPGKDGIPALTNPPMVRHGDPGTQYLGGQDRVVGLFLDGQATAIPLNIFWWHEIVNLSASGGAVAVTHCPLTGSSIAFDRAAVGGAEFGVSGLLFRNNLIMYDRNDPESLWPQMLRGARCGVRHGTALVSIPIVEMSWAGWLSLHPETLVVSSEADPSRNYGVYPYGSYDRIDNRSLLFPGAIDPRRPAKERVLGIPDLDGGIAFPYGALDELGEVAAVVAPGVGAGTDPIVFWDRARQGAMAFLPVVDREALTFHASGGQVLDDQTGSVWALDGRAVSGPLAGTELEPVAEAFVAFWFAWPEFYPRIQLWSAS